MQKTCVEFRLVEFACRRNTVLNLRGVDLCSVELARCRPLSCRVCEV